MFTVKPDFFDDFKCIADKCTDSCCIGWEIDVDETALEKYNKINTAFGVKIRSAIIKSEDGSNCFALAENERCPFLNENNLCNIIINCGKEYLCDICREHPRFYEWFAGVTECGLGLCCEEVCRILLENDEPFSLVEESDGEEIFLETEEDVTESDFYIFLSAFREKLFEILFDKNYNFEEKLVKILSETEAFCGEKIKIRDYKKSLELYQKTEPIDENWTLYINDLRNKIDEILKTEKEFQEKADGDKLYSKILAYIIYRHFIKAVFDKSIKERICFAVESVRFICLCDMKTYYENGSLPLKDRIENLKNWSKQVEYSEENTELLIYGERYG